MKLNHSSWTCVPALLQGWRRPTLRVHISTTPLITRSCWQCHVLPTAMSKTAPRLLARKFFFPFCDEASQRFTPGSDCKNLVLFFQTCCVPFVENARPACRLLNVTVAIRTCASNDIGKERGGPQEESMLNALGKTRIGASSAWFNIRSLGFSCLRRRWRFLRGSDGDPARQTETCEYEPGA